MASLFLGTEILGNDQGEELGGLTLEAFWEHSRCCKALAARLARLEGLDDFEVSVVLLTRIAATSSGYAAAKRPILVRISPGSKP